MNSLPSHMTLVYVVKTFKSKRHTVSDTDSYFAYPHHAIWGLTDNVDTIMRVEMVKVLIGSNEYLSAHHNSKKADQEEKVRALNSLEEAKRVQCYQNQVLNKDGLCDCGNCLDCRPDLFKTGRPYECIICNCYNIKNYKYICGKLHCEDCA